MRRGTFTARPSCYALMYVLHFISPKCGPSLENWVPSSSHQYPARRRGKQVFSFPGWQNKYGKPSRATPAGKHSSVLRHPMFERQKSPERQKSTVWSFFSKIWTHLRASRICLMALSLFRLPLSVVLFTAHQGNCFINPYTTDSGGQPKSQTICCRRQIHNHKMF